MKLSIKLLPAFIQSLWGLKLKDLLDIPSSLESLEPSKRLYLLGRTLEDFGINGHQHQLSAAALGPLEKELQEQKISPYFFYTFLSRVHQYEQGMPLAYILKSAFFLDIQLAIEKGVFIPRPETEELCTKVKKQIATDLAKKNSAAQPIKILEIGFGSGAISIALQKAFVDRGIQAEIHAIDSSKKAYACARKNAQRILGEQHGLKFILGDAFTSPEIRKPDYNYIVSNPPYVAEDSPDLESSVRKYEPHTALLAGKDGLDFYRKFAKFLDKTSLQKTFLFLEIGFDQEHSLMQIFSHLKNTRVQKDFLAKPRFFTALYERS